MGMHWELNKRALSEWFDSDLIYVALVSFELLRGLYFTFVFTCVVFTEILPSKSKTQPSLKVPAVSSSAPDEISDILSKHGISEMCTSFFNACFPVGIRIL